MPLDYQANLAANRHAEPSVYASETRCAMRKPKRKRSQTLKTLVSIHRTRAAFTPFVPDSQLSVSNFCFCFFFSDLTNTARHRMRSKILGATPVAPNRPPPGGRTTICAFPTRFCTFRLAHAAPDAARAHSRVRLVAPSTPVCLKCASSLAFVRTLDSAGARQWCVCVCVCVCSGLARGPAPRNERASDRGHSWCRALAAHSPDSEGRAGAPRRFGARARRASPSCTVRPPLGCTCGAASRFSPTPPRIGLILGAASALE